jgi:hypothetical protein
MSVKLKQENYFSKRPDISTLKDLAKGTNDVELPSIPETPHIKLPPPENSLLKNNYQIYSEDLFNLFNNPDAGRDKLQEELEHNKKNYFLKTKRKEPIDRDNSMPVRKKQRPEDEERSFDDTSNIQKSVNNFDDAMHNGNEEESMGDDDNNFLINRDNSDDYNYDF